MEKLARSTTPYREVNTVLAALLPEMQSVLGERLIGVSLYGSLALGDFNLAHSDIDFVAVTEGVLAEDIVAALGEMHARFEETEIGGAMRIEGCYMPRADLRRHDPEGGPYPMLNEKKFSMTRLGGDWIIQRYVMREHGVVVCGPHPREMIDPVGSDDLRWGVADVLAGWWMEQAENPEWIGEGVEMQVFAVQTMCRALYTLQRGEVASKPVSVRWAAESLGEPWRSLAGKVERWKEGEAFVPLAEVQAFIRYTAGCAAAVTTVKKDIIR